MQIQIPAENIDETFLNVSSNQMRPSYSGSDAKITFLNENGGNFVFVAFTSLPWPSRLLSTPVLGRRAGRIQMEESKTLGCGSLNV